MLTLPNTRVLFETPNDTGAAAPVDDPPATEPPAVDTPPASATADPGNDAFARMRREKAEAERRAKAAEAALAERERKEAEEQGRWKELAEQEKARADRLEAERVAAEQRRNAEKAAQDRRFRDTGYAMYLLAEQNVDLADPAAVSAALDGLATARADLIGVPGQPPPPPPSGGPAGGSSGDAPSLTRAQLEAMSPQQIAAIPPDQLAKALQAIGK